MSCERPPPTYFIIPEANYGSHSQRSTSLFGGGKHCERVKRYNMVAARVRTGIPRTRYTISLSRTGRNLVHTVRMESDQVQNTEFIATLFCSIVRRISFPYFASTAPSSVPLCHEEEEEEEEGLFPLPQRPSEVGPFTAPHKRLEPWLPIHATVALQRLQRNTQGRDPAAFSCNSFYE